MIALPLYCYTIYINRLLLPNAEFNQLATGSFLMPIIMQTDDKGVFEVSLTDEYYTAAQTFSLSVDELWMLAQQSVDFIFEAESFKVDFKERWNKRE